VDFILHYRLTEEEADALMSEVDVIVAEIKQGREFSFMDVLDRLGRFHHGPDAAEALFRRP